jgi:formamidopyrimidine-DNA glycosylase
MTDKRPIDANALYEDVSRMGLTNGSALGRHSGMADAIAQMIQDAPTIDPESLRGHARWVRDENVKIITVDAYGNAFESPAVYCENCNTALSEADFKGRVWNYCPVCGFIMEDATNE